MTSINVHLLQSWNSRCIQCKHMPLALTHLIVLDQHTTNTKLHLLLGLWFRQYTPETNTIMYANSNWEIKIKRKKKNMTTQKKLIYADVNKHNISKCKGEHLSTFTWVTCLPAGYNLCWHPNCLPLLVLCWTSFNRFKHSQRKNVNSRCIQIREHMTKDKIRRSVYPQPWLWLSFHQTMTSPS